MQSFITHAPSTSMTMAERNEECVANLFLDTRFSTDDLRPSDATFNIPSNFASRGFTKIQLHSAIIPNVLYPFNEDNNTIVFQENGSAVDITTTLTIQNYTGAQLASEVKSIMDAAGANVYDVSYDTQTGKLTIAINTGTSFRLMPTSTWFHQSGYSEVQVTESGFVTSLTGDMPVRLDGVEYLAIVLNEHGTHNMSVSGNGRYTVLGHVPLTAPFGNVVYWSSQSDKFHLLSSKDVNRVTLRLLQPDGTPVPLSQFGHNAQVAYTLRFSGITEEI